MARLCHFQEGDAYLSLTTYDHWESLRVTVEQACVEDDVLNNEAIPTLRNTVSTLFLNQQDLQHQFAVFRNSRALIFTVNG